MLGGPVEVGLFAAVPSLREHRLGRAPDRPILCDDGIQGDEESGAGWAERDSADTIQGKITLWNSGETAFKARRWPRA
ncbi:hypothetical protein VQ03_07605 [Methylobacterium tarhaniae]|uniref:Uncharacterized protein n=1 Tax=Methylobacterium tarhaniae TaxID=1187852 RepID=A0A0J6TDA5_9HYPH|nr:hypothetical protein [Methylobacterium tarhaniae]KMO43598.1 hypothetical protein VQ03_07605 [Methylobacterium tarhaniae]